MTNVLVLRLSSKHVAEHLQRMSILSRTSKPLGSYFWYTDSGSSFVVEVKASEIVPAGKNLSNWCLR